MAGNHIGGVKARDTLRRRLGEEGYRQHMRERGHRGGIARVPKGFALLSPEERTATGRKGGSAGRRGKVDEYKPAPYHPWRQQGLLKGITRKLNELIGKDDN